MCVKCNNISNITAMGVSVARCVCTVWADIYSVCKWYICVVLCVRYVAEAAAC